MVCVETNYFKSYLSLPVCQPYNAIFPSFSMNPALLTRRHLVRTSARLASALALSAGVPRGVQAQGALNTSVVFNISLEPDSFDPTMAPSASVGEVVHGNVLETLVKIQEDGSVAPLLAQSWTVAEAGRVYTFRLRKGVRFHDGTVMDASAVLFSFHRARAPGSTNKARKALFDNLANLAAPDPHTVVLTLHHADPTTLFRLGEGPACILHPHSASLAGTQPVGTGPYVFQHWKRGWGVALQKSGHFRDAAQVKMASAVFRFISDPQEQALAGKAGEVDVFFNIATQHVTQFLPDQRYQVLIGASSGKTLLALNHRHAALGDVRVRRAISHAIDRESFIRAALDGRGQAIGSHFSPSDAGYVHLADVYPFQPERARALLQQAGVRTPLALRLALPPTPYARLGGPAVVQALKAVGIEARVQLMDWKQWMQGPFRGDFDLTLINHVEPLDYAIYTDPGYYFGYDSAAFRALVQRHGASTRPRERQRLFADLQRHLATDAASAWLFAPQISTVARKGLQGLWMNYPIFAHDLAALSWQ